MIRPNIIIAAMLTLVSFAFGWGNFGHQLIAMIAEEHLTERAQAEVHDLLGEGSDGGQAEQDAEYWAAVELARLAGIEFAG